MRVTGSQLFAVQHVLDQSLAYPTVVWTGLLCLVVLYWLLVVLGAVAFDSLDGAIEGVGADGLDGLDGVGEGLDGAADALEGAADAADAASALSLFGLLKRRRAPVSVKASALALLAWPLSWYGAAFAEGLVPPEVPLWAWGTAGLVLTYLVASPIAAFALLPLEPIFDTHEARDRGTLIGEVVEVETSRVDRKFGQARLHDGQAGLILQVRCDPGRDLGRGKHALIVSYDEQDESYEVEPYDDLLRQRQGDT